MTKGRVATSLELEVEKPQVVSVGKFYCLIRA